MKYQNKEDSRLCLGGRELFIQGAFPVNNTCGLHRLKLMKSAFQFLSLSISFTTILKKATGSICRASHRQNIVFTVGFLFPFSMSRR